MTQYFIAWTEVSDAPPSAGMTLLSSSTNCSVVTAAVLSNAAAVTQPLLAVSGVAVGTLSVLAQAGGAAAAGGVAVAVLNRTAVPSGVSIDVGGLTAGALYAFSVACNNLGTTLGPVVPTQPATVSLQRPVIAAVTLAGVASLVLPTMGGVAVTVTGVNLGAGSAAVVMRLIGAAVNFTSARCTIVNASLVVVCPSPAGVGVNYSVVVTVDDVASAAFTSPAVSFAPPSIAALLSVVPSGSTLQVGTTAGGDTVVIRGANFGPAALSGWSLGAVTYVPTGFNTVRDYLYCSGSSRLLQCCLPTGCRTWT